MYKAFYSYLVILVLSVPLFSNDTVTVGVVSDGYSTKTSQIINLIKKEVDILTKGEFIVKFPKNKQLDGAWSKDGIESSLNKLYKDSDVDIVIALGFSTAAIVVKRSKYTKPTLVATIIHTNISNAPYKDKTSGKHNLNYITIQADLKDELKTFQKVISFKNVAIISDALIAEVMPNLRNDAKNVSKELGINIIPIPHKGKKNSIISKIPKNVDAVVIGALPRMSENEITELLKELTKKGLPTYAMVSSHLVNLGALSSAMPVSNFNQYSKRFALGIQSVLLGEDLKNLKVYINSNRQLTINMKTMESLNISPSFDVVLGAKKIDKFKENNVNVWDLHKISKEALLKNLTINSSKLNIDIGTQQVNEKESTLFPQLSVSINHQNRKDTGSDALAKQNGKASFSLNQILYDPSTWSNLDIEKLEQKVRILEHKQTKLDVLEDVNIAFLNILKAKTSKRMQEDNMKLSLENLNLAKNKAKIGTTTKSDIFRWESELANAQADFLIQNADLKESKEQLNQLLNRPFNEEFHIDSNILNNSELIMGNIKLYSMLDDNTKYEYLSKIFTEYGLNSSPEIATYLIKIQIQSRTLRTEKSKYYTPTLSLSGEYSNTYYDSRSDNFSQEGEDDWLVSLNLSLPLYEGGKRKHTVQRAKLTLHQLQAEIKDTKRSIEQNIRNSLRVVQVSKFSIKLKQRAQRAAQKNYDLVYDAYSNGSTGIIELIDAQNSKIIAKLNAVNSTYQFFIDLVKLQRSIGNIDFFFDKEKNYLEGKL